MKLDEMSNVMDVIEKKFQEMYVGGEIPVTCSDPDVQALINSLVNDCSGKVDLMTFIGSGNTSKKRNNVQVTVGDKTFNIKTILAYNCSKCTNNIVPTYANGDVSTDNQANTATFRFNAIKEGIDKTPTSLTITTTLGDRTDFGRALGGGCDSGSGSGSSSGSGSGSGSSSK